MISAFGWLGWAQLRDGPSEKVYTDVNAASGLVLHSAVGYLPAAEQRLFSLEVGPDGRYTPFAAASWHGWIAYDGSVVQYYPFGASCWHAGGRYPNTHYVGFECEGGPVGNEDEPLTPRQVAAAARVAGDLAAWAGWANIRRPLGITDNAATLWEHREMARFGSAPTACPSDRIPWDEVLVLAAGSDLPWTPSERDIAFAGAAAAVFHVQGRPLTDLNPYDQQVLRWLADQL